jgi:Recombination endonuclease VII
VNRKSYKPCRWCSEVLCYSDRIAHEPHCKKNPLCTTCPFCESPVNLRSEFREHVSGGCPNLPTLLPGHRFCSGCWGQVPSEGFSPDRDSDRNRCKKCRSEFLTQQYRTSEEFRLKHRQDNVRRNYGVTREQYNSLFESQGGKCAVCGKPPDGSKKGNYLHVDHDHETGEVRGLLCSRCNRGMGHFKDDVAVMLAAAEYLTRHQIVHTVS